MTVASEYIDALFAGLLPAPELCAFKKREIRIKNILRRRAWMDQRQRCAYCDKYMLLNEATADHIVPLSKGGKTERGNIAAACADCNSRKGSMDAEEFLLLCHNERNKPPVGSPSGVIAGNIPDGCASVLEPLRGHGSPQ